MASKEKLRVGLLFGGRSGEHEVSVNSAYSVASALDRDKYEVVLIGIDRDGRWRALSDATLRRLSEERQALDHVASDRIAVLPEPRAAVPDAAGPVGGAPALDVVFPVLHGTFGEDGCMQGLLELADLPYVGTGLLGSAVGMDKDVQKRLLRDAGLPLLPFTTLTRASHRAGPQAAGVAAAALGYPVFVKPANLGSSVGISKVAEPKDLDAALDEAFAYDDKIVIERGIRAREIECAVLGNDDPIASIPGEIRPRAAFYSYEAKYLDPDGAELLIPAPISPELTDEVQRMALAVFRTLEGAGMARVDFLLDDDSGELFVNELNSIPGFTKVSMYPKLWEHSGIPYPALLDRLIQLALERHARRAQLRRSWRDR